MLFIYREDMYQETNDPEKKNAADIIIAKQRNGPVGEVRLRFNQVVRVSMIWRTFLIDSFPCEARCALRRFCHTQKIIRDG